MAQLKEFPLDRDEFRRWLEAQGPVVGTGRKEPVRLRTVALTLGMLMTMYLMDMSLEDNSPLALFASQQLGQQVKLYHRQVHAANNWRKALGTLPAWAWAFDSRVKRSEEQPVTKEEALVALAQV